MDRTTRRLMEAAARSAAVRHDMIAGAIARWEAASGMKADDLLDGDGDDLLRLRMTPRPVGGGKRRIVRLAEHLGVSAAALVHIIGEDIS